MLLKCLCLLRFLLLRLACVPPPNRSEVLFRVWSACPWYLDHHLDVFCTISRGDSVLELEIIASIDSHRGPICFTSLTQHLLSLASARSRYVEWLVAALTASAFVLPRRLLGLRQVPATPMPTWECLSITWHLLVSCHVYVSASRCQQSESNMSWKSCCRK